MTEEMEIINARARENMILGLRANETAAFFKGDDAALMDKALFVAWLGELLSMTREEVERAELEDKDTAAVIFKGDVRILVNIAADSRLAIIKDVIRRGVES